MIRFEIRRVDSDHDFNASFKLICELRPDLTDSEAFASQVRRQSTQGYCLLAAWEGEQVMGLSGYRIQESLLYGRFLYIDDLITVPDVRRQGLGSTFIDHLRAEAHFQGCKHLVLDTGLGNALGQRFYFRQGLLAKGLHFSEKL
jgi:ribosomal protein S18 acetylase RimI-like enzyme